MRFCLVRFETNGRTTILADNVDGDTADMYLRHPAFAGAVVLSTWNVPVGAVR